MKRRDFLKTAGTGAVAGTAAVAAPYVHAQTPRLRWRMATSWPTSLDALYGGAERFCERVGQLTDGRFEIRPYAAGELVGGLQVLQAVQSNTVEMGHTASYYYIGQERSLAFECSLPFGLNTRMHNAWMYHGGGIELMNDEVHSNFNIVSFPCGNTTTQMGGWFRDPVPDLASLQGLRMRIPGFGGEVMQTLGVNVQTLAGGEIYPALERGVIDATEWIGPYDDERLGFWEVAKNYYYPSWWEPSTMFSTYINKSGFDGLPELYQQAIRTAAAEVNVTMVAHYDHLNPIALRKLVDRGVTLRQFSDEIMQAAQQSAFEIYEELNSENPTWRKIYEQWKPYRDRQYAWFNTAEQGFAQFAITQADPQNL